MDDEYAAFAGGKLKLKKVGDGVESAGKKRKKKNKERRKLEERGPKVSAEATEAAEKERDEEELKYRDVVEEEPVEGSFQRRYTKAELAYKKQQEKMQNERIKNKAMKTHKQRVEEFNRHLDNLTEHFDIPKVSWTK